MSLIDFFNKYRKREYIGATKKRKLDEIARLIKAKRLISGVQLINPERQARKRLCVEPGLTNKQLKKKRVLRNYRYNKKIGYILND